MLAAREVSRLITRRSKYSAQCSIRPPRNFQWHEPPTRTCPPPPSRPRPPPPPPPRPCLSFPPCPPCPPPRPRSRPPPPNIPQSAQSARPAISSDMNWGRRWCSGCNAPLAIQILPSLKFLKDSTMFWILQDEMVKNKLAMACPDPQSRQNDYRNHHPASIISIVQVPVNGLN